MGRKKVLIIDDDAAFRLRMRRILEPADFEVFEADTGQAGINAIERFREDLSVILVDLVLPDTSGYEIIGAVTRRPTIIKVIAASGIVRHPYIEIAKHIGAHAVIEKPTDAEPYPEQVWLDAIRNVLGAEDALGY